MKKIIISFILLIVLCSIANADSLYIAQLNKENFQILKISTDTNKEEIIYSQKGLPAGCVLDRNNKYISIEKGSGIMLLDLNAKNNIDIPNTKGCGEVSFIKNTTLIAYTRIIEDKENKAQPYKGVVEIYDYQANKKVNFFEGYSQTSSVLDSSLYFIKYDSKKNIIDINCYDSDKDKLIKKQSIKLTSNDDGPGGPYDITNAIGLSKDLYYYRVYDEHEYRYYAKDGNTPFYREDSKEYAHKEQYDLSFSPDGKKAVLAERNWNELTYIVYLDLVNKKNMVTNYYGSFPAIVGEKVYFVSDPDFMKLEEKDFKQIKNFALYSYNPKSNKLTEIKRFQGQIQIISYK